LLSIAALRERAVPLLDRFHRKLMTKAKNHHRHRPGETLGRLPVIKPLTRAGLAKAFSQAFDAADFA